MKSKIVNFTFLFLCISILLLSAGLSQLEPDEHYSYTENRLMAQYEAPTWESLWNGSWFGSFETYSKDQFFARTVTIQLYYRLLDSFGVRERNGYVMGEDGFVMPVESFYPLLPSQERVEAYAKSRVDAMAVLAQAADSYGGTVIYMNVPHKIELYSEKYPELYSDSEESSAIYRNATIQMAKAEGIPVVETYDLFQARKNEYIYYATDHHWSVRGAYYAYQELLTCIHNIDSTQKLHYPAFDALNITVNPERMSGSYLRQFGDSGFVNVDFMEYALPQDMPEFTRYDNGAASTVALCNTNEASYEAFMGGNIGNTVIETNRETLPSILYVGCSYTNPLEMMSVYNFDRVESIDPRYWVGSISQYIQKSQPDYIVIVRDDIYEGNSSFACTVE